MSSTKNHSSTHALGWIITIVIIILGVGLACNLPFGIQERLSEATPTTTAPPPTATPLPTATPQPLPPVVVETKQEMADSIATPSPIIFYFNQAMDQASVEDAFTSDPALSGFFRWENPSTLIFTPNMPLSPGDSLELQLSASAKAANGLSLSEPAFFQFYVPDYLRATHFLPSPESIDVDPASAVVATFNQPVVSLGADEQNLPAAFTLDPSASGQGEWINTSTYIFYPELALAGGVTYTVQLNASLRGTTGAPLEKAASWMFTTARPALVSASPENETSFAPLDASVELGFNQALDTMSVIENFSLLDDQGQQVQGLFEWSDDFATMIFTPRKILDRGIVYTYILSGAAKAAGGTPLGTDIAGTFTTVTDLRLWSSSPSEGASTSVSQGVTLYFNSSIENENVEEYLAFSPDVPNLRTWWDKKEHTLHINGSFQALTKYTLVISDQLADKWGSTLGGEIPLHFSTQPLQPNLLVSYGVKDIFITAQEIAIPVQGTNISQATLEIGEIPFEHYETFLSETYTYSLNDYVPVNNQTWIQPLNLPGDSNHHAYLPLTSEGEVLSPGLYRYSITSSELSYSPGAYLLAVTNTNLTLKVSPTSILVWAIDLRTNLPIPDAPISVDLGTSLVSGKTDPDGVFAMELSSPIDLSSTAVYAILGEPGNEFFGFSTTLWRQGIEPYNYHVLADYNSPAPMTYLYTDRPIYRPGQTVYFRAVQRDAYNGRYTIPLADTLSASIVGTEGKLETFELPLSEYGTAHGEYTLSESAQPGYYRIETEDDIIIFQVAEYRKPEIELEVSLTSDDIQAKDEFSGNLNAHYYFGAPAGGITANWKLTAQTTQFSLPGYRVGISGYGWHEVASGSETTSPTGGLSLALEASPQSIYGDN
ncbi:MAG: Ig-like domain-containing protein, partial [Chloroflexota bacterium]|nr:Ig-like domain-containing protein [Chloroflexota bacterium]